MRSVDETLLEMRGNALLAYLDEDEQRLIMPHVSIRSYRLGDVLFADDEHSDTAYFPISAMISMIAEMADGSTLEY